MKHSIRLLSIEDNEDDYILLCREIERVGFHIEHSRRVDTLPALEEALLGGPWSLCICDFNLPTFHALSALAVIQRSGTDLPTIVVSGSVDDQVAAAVFRAGARDLITKQRLARLGPAITRELEEATIRRERARAIEQLRNSEERFRLFTQRLPACVWIVDAEGRYVYVNEPWLELFGADSPSVIGREPREVFGDDRLAPIVAQAERVRETRQANESVQTLVDRGGLERNFTVMTFPLGDGGQIASIGIDVTERKHAEDALRSSEERFRSVADAAGDAMVTIDAGGIVTFVNVAAERMLERPSASMCGRPMTDLLAMESREGHTERLARVLALPERGPASFVMELMLESASGSEIPIEMSLGSWTNDGQRFITAIFRDLRQRRELENQLRQSQKMEAVGQLAGGVAHDFNNILSVIDGLSEMIADQLGAESAVTSDLEEIRRAVDRGATLVRQLLAFSRKQVVLPTIHNLNEVVQDMAKMLRRAIGSGVTLKLDLDPALESIRADRGQMEQILMNLAINARDAMPRGGKLVIQTSNGGDPPADVADPGDANDGWVTLRVTDDGAGMDAATIAHIFEPFFTTKGVGAGSGLGLSTVYGIVKQARGHIDVDSTVRAGTTFEIRFPAVLASSRLSTTSQEVYTPIGRGETVLVVERDEKVRASMVQSLRRHGYSVIDVDRAEDAARIGQSHELPVAAAVCAMNPIGMSGPNLMEQLREAGSTIPFVFTVETTEPQAEFPGDSTDVVYLRKPFSTYALLTSVRKILGETKESR